LTNSQILIVGAMVVGPEYNAIMGIALGIDKRDRQPVFRGALALLAGFTAAIIMTLLFGLAVRWSGGTPEAYQLGLRPVSDLIDTPDVSPRISLGVARSSAVTLPRRRQRSSSRSISLAPACLPARLSMGGRVR
jgi:uncharacterized membrane protein